MNQLSSMNVAQIRLFRPDEIPLQILQLPVAVQEIRQAFGFGQLPAIQYSGIPDFGGGIAYANGQFSFDDSNYPIVLLQIEPRRIRIGASGSSRVVSSIFDRLREIMIKLDTRAEKPVYEPILLTDETTTVIRLDFPITRLFDSQDLRDLASGLESKVAHHGAEIKVVPSGIRFRVAFDQIPDSLRKYGASILDKDIRIELRSQTQVDDNVYFISSPNTSDAHLELVSYFEKTFGGKK
jgi:hypothetical protein